MQKKDVTFDEVYDILAIRIVVDPKPNISEKRQCFDILSLVTDIYTPKPDRIRDWITTPKGKWLRIVARNGNGTTGQVG